MASSTHTHTHFVIIYSVFIRQSGMMKMTKPLGLPLFFVFTTSDTSLSTRINRPNASDIAHRNGRSIYIRDEGEILNTAVYSGCVYIRVALLIVCVCVLGDDVLRPDDSCCNWSGCCRACFVPRRRRITPYRALDPIDDRSEGPRTTRLTLLSI